MFLATKFVFQREMQTILIVTVFAVIMTGPFVSAEDTDAIKPASSNTAEKDELLKVLVSGWKDLPIEAIKKLLHQTSSSSFSDVKDGVGFQEFSFASSIATLDVATQSSAMKVLEKGVLSKMGDYVSEAQKSEVHAILSEAMGRGAFALTRRC